MNDTLATQTEHTLQYIKLAEEKLIEVANYSAEQLPYQALSNLAELPVVGVHAVTGKGYAKHYGHDK